MFVPEFVAFVGSRTYPLPEAVRSYVRRVHAKYPRATLVSGGCRQGVDTWAEKEALRIGMPTLIFPADWATLGKKAGFVRNETIVQHSEVVVAFCNPASRGTRNTILHAIRYKRRLFVYNECNVLLSDGTGYWC